MGVISRVGLIGAVVLTAGAARATTTLITIPIADILAHREVYGWYSISGNERSIDSRYYHSMTLDLGLYNRLELGMETDFDGEATWNAKVLLAEREGLGAISAGVWHIDGSHGDPFVIARFDHANGAFHAGWLNDDRARLICGVDYTIQEGLVAALEHSSGDGGMTWLALTYDVPQAPGLSVMVVGGYPNTREDGIQHFVSFGYGFEF